MTDDLHPPSSVIRHSSSGESVVQIEKLEGQGTPKDLGQRR